MLRILFKKGQDKKSTLTCIRPDGTRTWTDLQDVFGPEHDICHFVVEEELELKRGFYGLIASGRDIEDFIEIDAKEWIGPDGLIAESIVMALQYERRGVADRDSLPDLIKASCGNFDLDPPRNLTYESLDDMRLSFHLLMQEWEELQTGETIELTFEA